MLSECGVRFWRISENDSIDVCLIIIIFQNDNGKKKTRDASHGVLRAPAIACKMPTFMQPLVQREHRHLGLLSL